MLTSLILVASTLHSTDDIDRMSFWNFLEKHQDTFVNWGHAAQQVTEGFLAAQAKNNEQEEDRISQILPLARGYGSILSILHETTNLEMVRLMIGQGDSNGLVQRLRSLDIRDFMEGPVEQGIDLYKLMFKLLLQAEEAEKMQQHSESIAQGAKALEDLLKMQIESLLRHLMTTTPKTDPAAREFYHNKSSSPRDLTTHIFSSEVGSKFTGGSGEVYQALLCLPGKPPQKVAVKVIRVNVAQLNNAKKKFDERLRTEVDVWRRLEHRNILHLLGLTHNFNGSPFAAMVCPWMENGTLGMYLKTHTPEVTLSDRFRLTTDVSDGISYLHSQSVIHRDLTSANVLIDSDLAAKIADFGLSRIISEFPEEVTTRLAGAPYGAAPELYTYNMDKANGDLDGGVYPPIGKPCDIYSLGCIIFEIFSGRQPYEECNQAYSIVCAKAANIPPARPTLVEAPFLSEDIWSLIEKCWRRDPFNRPEVGQVLEAIEQLKNNCTGHELKKTLPTPQLPSESWSGSQMDLD